MNNKYIYLPLFTVVTVIAIFLAYQNTVLKNNAEIANERAAIAQKQRQEIQEDLNRTNKETEKNQDYIRCIAEIFAKYTQNYQPITKLNLDTCTTSSSSKASVPEADTSDGSSPSAASVSPVQVDQTNPQSPPQNTQASPPPQQNNSQPQPQTLTNNSVTRAVKSIIKL